MRCGKGAMHSGHVGLNTGQELKCLDRLMYAHAAAVEHAGTLGGSGFEELRFDRCIDNVGGPM